MALPTNGYLISFYEELKFWLPLIGIGWGAFKSITWFKEVRTVDIPQVKQMVTDVHSELRLQTTEVVKALSAQTNELKELRSDFRTYSAPLYAKAAKRKN